ncbi:MAG TPA: hypothetical protein VH141_09490 [Pseudonocardia sp.]|jgi:uncharacterized membrane protein|nr:hypothetical protein [Pseudonocardia sp.]
MSTHPDDEEARPVADADPPATPIGRGAAAPPAATPTPAAAPPNAAPPDAAHVAQLTSVKAELTRLEELLCGGHRPITAAATGVGHELSHGAEKVQHAAKQVHVPAWLRVTRGESRWPVAGAMVVAIALQLALPDRLTLVSRWMLPSLEAALLLALIAANPTRMNRESTLLRIGSLTLTALVSLANAWAAVVLATDLVAGRAGEEAGPLLSTGAAVWLTNIIAFALWYWQFDRGGPAARAHARRKIPDFVFVQMQSPEMAHPDWEPAFVDYLYLSFTNATAFSPTDVMPLSRWAKLTMLVQSLVSLVTVALVIARAVNILK